MADIDFKFTREELLSSLSTMGVELLIKTRLPDDALEKRLKQALDCAQQFAKFSFPLGPTSDQETVAGSSPATANENPGSSTNGTADPSKLSVARIGVNSTSDSGPTAGGDGPDASVDPSNFASWPENEKKRLATSMSKFNFVDLLEKNWDAEVSGDTFMCLRRAVAFMANVWAEGTKIMMVPDRELQSIIIIEVVAVYKQKDEPLFCVAYSHFMDSEVSREKIADFLQEKRKSNHKLTEITCSLPEQKLLLKLLQMNTKRLSKTFLKEKLSGKLERSFKPSFLLPIGPLDFHDIGSLHSKTGCAACGETKKTMKCAQCHSVAYCCSDCQRADWRNHKRTCKSIAGGTWKAIGLLVLAEGPRPSLYATSIHKFNRIDEFKRAKSYITAENAALTNIHGDRIFVMKVQWTGGFSPLSSVRLYDRQKSFEVDIWNGRDPNAFAAFCEIFEDRSGHGPVKVYRWAKITGGKEFTVCADKAPPIESTRW